MRSEWRRVRDEWRVGVSGKGWGCVWRGVGDKWRDV